MCKPVTLKHWTVVLFDGKLCYVPAVCEQGALDIAALDFSPADIAGVRPVRNGDIHDYKLID